jgi:hypothetical protein
MSTKSLFVRSACDATVGAFATPTLEAALVPRMSGAEVRLFESFARRSAKYLEFGAGGSTCLAARHVKESVLSVDCSEQWINEVAAHCRESQAAIQPCFIYADIGPVGEWGYPVDSSRRSEWPSYFTRVWADQRASASDLFLVDGRFRVACFAQIVLHCDAGAVILFHDFASRRQYHVVKEIAREIAIAEDLSVFQPLKSKIRKRARQILKEYAFTVD